MRIHPSGRIFLLLAAQVAVMGVLAQPASAAPFRAFSDSSPWNIPAAEKGAISSGNPYAGQFTSYDSTMNISGIPPHVDYAKPTFFASPGDPEVPVRRHRARLGPHG